VRASAFEFRFRLWIILAVYVLGFWAPWARYGTNRDLLTTTWLELSGELGRVMSLQTATIAVTLGAILVLAVGAIFRVWGTAYIGASVMQSSTLHAQGVVAAGPYRYVRNPLYLGSYAVALGIAVLMPPTGAIFFVIALFLLILRLILREEPYLASQQSEQYLAYKRRVPRLLPSIRARVPRPSMPEPSRARWIEACAAETFPILVTLSFAVLAWRYNADLLIRAVVISFGVSLVVRALVDRRK
jgi:protein-S-isoprenylcysteine O-methyltransferase Ste14